MSTPGHPANETRKSVMPFTPVHPADGTKKKEMVMNYTRTPSRKTEKNLMEGQILELYTQYTRLHPAVLTPPPYSTKHKGEYI